VHNFANDKTMSENPGTFFYRSHVLYSERDGTWRRTGGEVKGKDANGVGSQQTCTVSRNMVYPALLPTIKTYDKMAKSVVSRELGVTLDNFNITVSI